MLSFLLSHHKITLFEKKYVIKLITLISMYHSTSCEFEGLFKIKIQMYKLLIVFTLLDPFHNYFS